jgi:CheY-like chemotaxis protein
VGKVVIETGNLAFDEAYRTMHPDAVVGEYAMLAVSDNGVGMDKQTLSLIFEPFFTTKEAGKGTGLGLATVYGILKQNSGFIHVYSEPGQGTTFRIYLPRFTGTPNQPAAAGPIDPPMGQGETILLVEDEPMILEVAQAMLETLGYRVLTAQTPGEALHQVATHDGDIALVLTDVVMPEMNGRDLAHLLRANRPGLKCLFASGYTANIIAHHGVLDEGVVFIQKPFLLHNLAVKVREALAQQGPEQGGQR